MDEAHGKVLTHEQSAKSNGVCLATVINTTKLFTNEGINGITYLKRSGNSDNAYRKLDERAEARIIEMACDPAPEGHARWTTPASGEKARIELDTPVSKAAIGRALKKRLRPHKNDYWCIPSKEGAEFVACM